MKLNLLRLLHATTCCLILLVAASYATSATVESAQTKLQEPEVKAPPLRRGSMKYGDTLALNKSVQSDNLVAATTMPATLRDPSSRRGKRIDTAVKKEEIAANVIEPPTTNRSGERKPVRKQTNRDTPTTSAVRPTVRNESKSSQETSSNESRSEDPSLSWSKETSSEERQTQRSREAVSEEQSTSRSSSLNRSKEIKSKEIKNTDHEPLRIIYDSSKEKNSSPVATPGSANNEHPSPVQDRLRRRNPTQESKAQRDVFMPTKSVEHTALRSHPPGAQIARRPNAVAATQQNQIVVQQYDIPIVQKTHQTAQYKPITSTVGQQKQQHEIPNRIRISPEHPHHPRTATNAATATSVRQHSNQQQPQQLQQQLIAPTRSQDSLLSSRNSNRNSVDHGRRNSAEITAHSGSNASPYHHHRSASHEHFNTAHLSVAAGTQHPAQSVTNVANGGPPHLRKPSPSATAIPPPQPPPPPTTTTPRPFFSLPNQYNIFSSEFWQFLLPSYRANPPTTTTVPPFIPTTKRPPKKYVPPQQVSSKEEKLNYPKPKPTFQTQEPYNYNNNDNNLEHVEHTTATRKEDGPFRIALPTFNFLNPRKETIAESEKDKRNTNESDGSNNDLRAKVNCPRESEVRFQLFPKICKIDDDCKTWNRGEICCDIFGAKSCVTGVPKPLEEASHSPILGLIPRKCPNRPLAELWWEVKECETDMDCWPRVCCPDGRRRYCRTSQPELNTVPVPVKRSFNYLTEYLECTAPPPRIFDLHPKACTSTLDCFPNVCCQEAGLRHCRPPKKSVLTMLANVFNVDLVKRLTQNIVIK